MELENKVLSFYKVANYIIFVVLCFLLGYFNVNAFELCAKDSGVIKSMKLLGVFLLILKILIPLLIIIFGCIDFGKAIISSDEKEVFGTASKFVKRIVLGVIVFFIPTILNFIFSLVYNIDVIKNDDDLQKCTECLLDINRCS